MLIFFGWGHQKTDFLGPALLRTCENCHNYEGWQLVNVSTWFTLFFLPVFPYRIRRLLLCPVCGRGVELTREQFLTLQKGPLREALLTLPNDGSRELCVRTIIAHQQAPSASEPEIHGLLPDPIVGTWALQSVSYARDGGRQYDLHQMHLPITYQFDGDGTWFANRNASESGEQGTWHREFGGEYALIESSTGKSRSGLLIGAEYCEVGTWFTGEPVWFWFRKS